MSTPLAFLLGYAAGFVAEQFLVNALTGGVLAAFKVGDKVMDAVRALKKGLETAKDALGRVASRARMVTGLVGQKVASGLARHLSDIFERLGLRWSDEALGDFSRTASRFGCSCETLVRKFDDLGRRFDGTLDDIRNTDQPFLRGVEYRGKDWLEGHWNTHKKQFPDLEDHLQYEQYAKGVVTDPNSEAFVYYYAKKGEMRYGFWRASDGVFVAVDGHGRILTMFKPDPPACQYILRQHPMFIENFKKIASP